MLKVRRQLATNYFAQRLKAATLGLPSWDSRNRLFLHGHVFNAELANNV